MAEANVKALTNANNEIVNISCNTQDSINKLIDLINEILGKNIKPKSNIHLKTEEGA